MKDVLGRLINRSGESQLISMLREHVESSIKASKIIIDILSGCCSSIADIEKMANEVMLLEKKADSIADKINSIITRGSVAPAIISDLQYIVDKTDDVLDGLYFMGMELSRAYRLGINKNKIIEEIYRDITKMISLAQLGIEKLLELYRSVFTDYKKATAIVKDIDTIEDRIDEDKNMVLDKIYSHHKELDAIEMFHLIELVRVVDSIADATEDAAQSTLRVAGAVYM